MTTFEHDYWADFRRAEALAGRRREWSCQDCGSRVTTDALCPIPPVCCGWEMVKLGLRPLDGS